MKIFCGLLIFYVCVGFSVHSPYSNSFVIAEVNGETTLTVHTTPAALTYLVKATQDSLKEETLINLKENKTIITEYFTEHIHLMADSKKLSLKNMIMESAGHHALLKFEVNNLNTKTLVYSGSITAFSDVFKRFENIVEIKRGEETSNIFLLKKGQLYFEEGC